MKNDREPNEVNGLLNAVLADDDWHALNCSLKREALTAIGVARRRRRLVIWFGQGTCAAALLVGAVWWLRPPSRGDMTVAEISGQPPSAHTEKHFIGEDEMLAMFPAGSCVVAEVNGQKTLVFFDAKKAEEGFAWSRQ
jgi:hypothetical protein